MSDLCIVLPMSNTDPYGGHGSGTTPEPWLTITQAAALIGYSVDSLRRWDKKGKLPAHRTLGGHRVYRASELLAAVQPAMPEQVAS